MFCINPALIGRGTAAEISLAIVTALIGSFGLAVSVQRYFKGRLNIIQTLMALLGSVTLMMPGKVTDAVGILLLGTVIAMQIMKEKQVRAAAQ